MRGINAEALALLESGSAIVVPLVWFDFSTPVSITMAQFAVPHGGRTYQPSPELLDISDVEETAEVRVNTVTFTLSGASQLYQAIFLGEDTMNVAVEYRLAILRPDYTIADTVELFIGTIDAPDLKEDTKRSRVQVKASGYFADWQRPIGRLGNHASFFEETGDSLFEFVDQAQNSENWTIR